MSELQAVDYVYIGRRITTAGKLSRAFVPFETNGEQIKTTSFHCFNKAQLGTSLVPGMVVRFFHEGDSVYLSGETGPQCVGTWSDADAVLAWQLDDRAALNRDKQRLLTAKLGKDLDLISERLAPIKRYLSRKDEATRASIIQHILKELLER